MRNIKSLKNICEKYWVAEAQIFTMETYDQNNDVHTRNISPREGIEDPACGIWSGALLAYIDHFIYKDKNDFSLKLEQWNIVDMPSLVNGYVNNWIVTTGWKWIIMSEGCFNLP